MTLHLSEDSRSAASAASHQRVSTWRDAPALVFASQDPARDRRGSESSKTRHNQAVANTINDLLTVATKVCGVLLRCSAIA
jgi:hypothetical protein